MLEFAGNKFIYFPKIKKDKIKKIRESENGDAPEAPIINMPNAKNKMENKNNEISNKLKKYGKQDSKPKQGSDISDSSDDAYLQVNFKDFNIDLENSRINPLEMSNKNAAPNINFKKAIDTNACVIRYLINLTNPNHPYSIIMRTLLIFQILISTGIILII